jgi:recombination protein RecR
MPDFAAPLQRLIDEFRRLPGIGQKSAQRLAFHVLRHSRDDAARLGDALLDVKDHLGICVECNNISDADLCPYCRDPQRDRSQICVLEEPHNILPIETTRTFEGLYHVLGGAISPLRGIGPEQLKIKGLLDRIARGEAKKRRRSSWRPIRLSKARPRRSISHGCSSRWGCASRASRWGFP